MTNRIAIYARVSTADQTCANQTQEIHTYCAARGWHITEEYIDVGVSGAKESRPQLDRLLKDARRRKFDVLVVWRLDRLGRNLRHLILLLDDLHALGVSFVSLAEGIDASTPAGKLQLHVLGAIAEFERGRIQERVRAGLARAKARGARLGRPRVHGKSHPFASMPVREAARIWGISKSAAARRIAREAEGGTNLAENDARNV